MVTIYRVTRRRDGYKVAIADSIRAVRPWLGDKRFTVTMTDATYMPLLVPKVEATK